MAAEPQSFEIPFVFTVGGEIIHDQMPYMMRTVDYRYSVYIASEGQLVDTTVELTGPSARVKAEIEALDEADALDVIRDRFASQDVNGVHTAGAAETDFFESAEDLYQAISSRIGGAAVRGHAAGVLTGGGLTGILWSAAESNLWTGSVGLSALIAGGLMLRREGQRSRQQPENQRRAVANYAQKFLAMKMLGHVQAQIKAGRVTRTQKSGQTTNPEV